MARIIVTIKKRNPEAFFRDLYIAWMKERGLSNGGSWKRDFPCIHEGCTHRDSTSESQRNNDKEATAEEVVILI